MKVGVVLVSYNTWDALRACLTSLRGEADAVVVVDNASRDDSASLVRDLFPEVRVIANSRNIGFGAACNQGMDALLTDLVLFLNSDCLVTPGAVRGLAEVFSDAGVAGAGGRLEFPDGTLQESCAGELTLRAVRDEQLLLEKWNLRRGRASYWRSARLVAEGPGPHPVEQVMGACLMIRRQSARFDERFFLYAEDTDLCRRLRSLGTILYVPEARFSHALGSSTAGRRSWSVAMYNRGKELYFLLHHGRAAMAVCWWLNRCGAALRMSLWLLRGRLDQVRLFAQVLLAPRNGPQLPPDSGIEWSHAPDLRR